MQKNIFYIIIILIISLNNSCISEYNPTQLSASPEILVVDGIITNGETVIRLSKSIALNQKFDANNQVVNAKVFIETDNGEIYSKAIMSDVGKYVFSNVELSTNKSYRLKIEIGNDTFVSEFLSPLTTPEIDSVTWKKTQIGEPVKIYVHTKDSSDILRFYRWTFEEIWEFTAALYANGTIINDSVVLYDKVNGPFNENYYCWLKNNSTNLIVESSANLSENIIRYKKIHEITPSSNRLSILYYLKVNQYHIRQSAYDYFANQQKNIESMGSIYGPIPSEMKGNIQCLNRDLPVIGYMDVSINTNKFIYISGSEKLYEPKERDCEISTEMFYGYLPYYYEQPPVGFNYAPAECIDCVKAGGSKNKPSFWPNNHF